MQMMKYDSPLGTLYLAEEDHAITGLYFGRDRLPAEVPEQESGLLKKAKAQLEEYFAGKRRVFDLPLNPKGTAFQQKVWQALQEIPYGETRSYKEIAGIVGSPKGMRAVGMANNRNPISILIPCHRVIGADGALVGYGGGLDLKRELLALEK